MLIDLDKQNLKRLISQYNYDFQYLNPNENVTKIEQKEKDIFYWNDKEKKVRGRRRIYYKVQYQKQQIQAIQEVLLKMHQKGLKLKMTKQLVLKHLYVQNFCIPKTIQRIKLLQQFYDSSITKLTDKTIQNLRKGFIYTYGYSKDYRPIFIIRVDRISSDMEIQEIFNTLYYLMLVMCGYKMKPFHSEKYIIIIDLNNMNISQIPYPRIYSCLTKLALYSCGFTDHNFVMNANGIWAVWAFVKTFLPQHAIKKITFLYDDKKPLLQLVDPSELQQKYGGIKSNIQEDEFWPPVSSPKCIRNTSISNQKNQETDFYSVYNEQDLFVEEYGNINTERISIQMNCCGPTQCNIY